MHDYNGLKAISTWMAAALIAGCAHAPAQPPAARTPAATPPKSGQAPPARHAVKTANLAAAMRADAPARYVVKRGDTLWAIASDYLRRPWYWPALWHANPAVTNPDLIYPGEVLVLTRSSAGAPQLRGQRVEHLSPRVRAQPVAAAIPTIPYAAIRDFLTGPRLVSAQTLDAAPYIVSFLDRHLVAGAQATAYIRGARADGPQQYAIVRPAGPYKDSQTGEILGEKALPVGALTIETFGRIATGRILGSDREVLTGDRLLPVENRATARDFRPHAPAAPVAAHLISVYGGVTNIGPYQVVTLDRGRNAGLERGDVLAIFEAAATVVDPVAGDPVTLPAHRVGELMVFKTEQRVAFALIMRATRAVHIDDLARSPGP